MQRFYQQPPGTDYDSIVVGSNLQIGSVVVNNPTGAWLWCEQTSEYIPPYTLNWARTFTPSASRVTFRWIAVGPDGTVSIYLGDLSSVTLYDDATGGMSNGQPFTPLTRRGVFAGTMPVAASLTNIGFVGPDLGRHIRSILVDNPSQNWLQLAGYNDTIPPNTVGWGKVLPDAPLNITITAMAIGPDGSPSVALGDPPILTLLDDLSSGNVTGSPYVPVAHKRIVTTVGFGNLGATAFIGADAGRFVAGVILDNPSGSWLTLVVGGATYYIAPYTMQWIKRIDPPAADVTSLTFAAAGPAGQVSTLAGDQVTLTLLDQPPDKPDTSAFIGGFTPVLFNQTAVGQLVRVSIANLNVINTAGIANRRMRLLSWHCHLSSAQRLSKTTVTIFLGGSAVQRIALWHEEINHSFSWEPGVDGPLGGNIVVVASTDWQDITLHAGYTYQVI